MYFFCAHDCNIIESSLISRREGFINPLQKTVDHCISVGTKFSSAYLELILNGFGTKLSVSTIKPFIQEFEWAELNCCNFFSVNKV